MTGTPERQIRASYTKETIRVYQAYSNAIADSALSNGTFVSPPFKVERMTWIKPSFLWMMYRSGWAQKDSNQNRILAIDIAIEGFEWALSNSCLSHKPQQLSDDAWMRLKAAKPVRIQWDPERDLGLNPLSHRAIQIGLSGEAVEKYIGEWIHQITDVTDVALKISERVNAGHETEAKSLLPMERVYSLSEDLSNIVGASSE